MNAPIAKPDGQGRALVAFGKKNREGDVHAPAGLALARLVQSKLGVIRTPEPGVWRIFQAPIITTRGFVREPSEDGGPVWRSVLRRVRQLTPTQLQRNPQRIRLVVSLAAVALPQPPVYWRRLFVASENLRGSTSGDESGACGPSRKFGAHESTSMLSIEPPERVLSPRMRRQHAAYEREKKSVCGGGGGAGEEGRGEKRREKGRERGRKGRVVGRRRRGRRWAKGGGRGAGGCGEVSEGGDGGAGVREGDGEEGGGAAVALCEKPASRGKFLPGWRLQRRRTRRSETAGTTWAKTSARDATEGGAKPAS